MINGPKSVISEPYLMLLWPNLVTFGAYLVMFEPYLAIVSQYLVILWPNLMIFGPYLVTCWSIFDDI